VFTQIPILFLESQDGPFEMNYVKRKFSDTPQEDFTVPRDFQMDPFIFDYPHTDLVAFYYRCLGNCAAPLSGLQFVTEQWRYGFLEGGFDETEEIEYMSSILFDIAIMFIKLAKSIHVKAIDIAMTNPDFKRFYDIGMLETQNQPVQVEIMESEEDLDELLERFCEQIMEGMKRQSRYESLEVFALNHEDFGKESKEAVEYLKKIHTIMINMKEKMAAFAREYE